jgi:hypothetical protein
MEEATGVPEDVLKKREANKRSYKKHREERLAKRRERFAQEEERLRKNQQSLYYYYRNREETLQKKREYAAARSEEAKAKAKEYQRQYYLAHKEEITLRQKVERAEKAPRVVEKPPPRPRPVKEKTKVNKSRLPKQYIVYEDSEESIQKADPFKVPKSAYQRKKMKDICVKGFFEPTESPHNPFLVTW